MFEEAVGRVQAERLKASEKPMGVKGPVVNEKSLNSATAAYLDVRLGPGGDSRGVMMSLEVILGGAAEELGMPLVSDGEKALAVQYAVYHALRAKPGENGDEMRRMESAVTANRQKLFGGNQSKIAQGVWIANLAEGLFGSPTLRRENETPNPLGHKIRNMLNQNSELEVEAGDVRTRLWKDTEETRLPELSSSLRW